MSGLIEVAGLAATLLFVATWLVVVALGPARVSREGSPRRRLVQARAWLYAPLWAPPLILLAALAPGLLGAFSEHGDHCLRHGGGHHHHLCLLHPPHASGDPLIWGLPLLIVLPVVFAVVRSLGRSRARRRLAETLVATSRPWSRGSRDEVGLRLLERDEILAFTVGLRAPTVMLSAGLVERASSETLEVVLAHERAHVARGDTRQAALDELAAALLPRATAAALLDAINLAREQACDATAAERFGRLEVARALTEVARLGLRAPAVGVGMAASALEARVLHLLEPPASKGRGWLVLTAVLAALLLAGAGPVHGAVEHLITFLLH